MNKRLFITIFESKNPMKILINFVIFLTITNSFAQKFNDDFGNTIDFTTKEISIDIENFDYNGIFDDVYSKKDKCEYLVFDSGSRIIVLKLENDLNFIKSKLTDFKIETVKIIHSYELKSIKKGLVKDGIVTLNKLVVVYDSNNTEFNFRKSAFLSTNNFKKAKRKGTI